MTTSTPEDRWSLFTDDELDIIRRCIEEAEWRLDSTRRLINEIHTAEKSRGYNRPIKPVDA